MRVSKSAQISWLCLDEDWRPQSRCIPGLGLIIQHDSGPAINLVPPRRADKRRWQSIARGELCEAVSAVEVDQALGGCSAERSRAVHQLGGPLNAMLAPLTR